MVDRYITYFGLFVNAMSILCGVVLIFGSIIIRRKQASHSIATISWVMTIAGIAMVMTFIVLEVVMIILMNRWGLA